MSEYRNYPWVNNYIQHLVMKYGNDFISPQELYEYEQLFLKKVPELRAIAKVKKLPQYSFLTKDQLCLMIMKNQSMDKIFESKGPGYY